MYTVLFDYLEKYVTLSAEEKSRMVEMDVFRTVPKGTVLLQEGDYSRHSYFVLRGCLRSYYLVDGKEKTTAFYTELEGLTPHCVTAKAASGYYVSTVEDSVITVSTSDQEEDMFRHFPKFETLCRILSEELLAKQQIDFDQFKLSSPEQRYRQLLAQRPDLLQRIPQHQLASYLGVTPQSLSRLRSRIHEKRS